MVSAILLLLYAALSFINSKYAWVFGIIAVVISQLLIIVFWKDAKFGTLPNILILAVVVVLFSYYNFQNLIQKETIQLYNNNIITERGTLLESDLKNLPLPVVKWLRNSGALGKPFISNGKIVQSAEMKLKPEQENWMTARAVQYTFIENPSFIWSVDVSMNSLLSFQGRDKFYNGKGEMLIKLHSLFNIVNEQGKKLDEGTLQRYLGEMVWFPSLAVSPYITWEQIDETTAKATMTYKGTTGSGTFYFNSHGDVTKFSALRYKDNHKDAKRYHWEMNILDYRTFDGIKVPALMTAKWKLDGKDWTWLKLEITDITYNTKL